MIKHTVKFGIGESGTKVQRTQYSVGKRSVNVLRKELDTKSYKVGSHKVSAQRLDSAAVVQKWLW